MARRWPLSRRAPTNRTETPHSDPPVLAPPAAAAPQPGAYWLTDTDFLARLHEATLTVLDLVDNVMYDDMTLVEALAGVCDHASDMLGIPPAFASLVEAEASAQIVESAGLPVGSPFGPVIAAGLTHIEGLDIEEQQRLVQAAARRYALTHRTPTTSARPRAAQPLPPAAPSNHQPGRNP
ncbi:hypothetical protein [Streptomyces sp. NPDC088141]|uniref:hypothetical protein n=1 Tax=Streptomyces sp. NPDC088141 TaxID=3155179 RepID=UPI003412C582